jgi:hypothetical protein
MDFADPRFQLGALETARRERAASLAQRSQHRAEPAADTACSGEVGEF